MQSFQNSFRSIQEIPLPYRNVFREYPCFNIVQSEVLDDAIKTDKSLVISAPTGSGKTAIFEMAIIRHLILSKESSNTANNKIVYVSPIKALCKERLVDWHEKFADFNIRCISVTSDTDEVDMRNMAQYNLIITTPEKWDIISKRWRENCNLIGSINLFLIDEVHLLNADSRGPALEVIVSRMKTAIASLVLNQEKLKIRFVALSATIPNLEDIAEWIGPPETTKYFKFSEEVRPVKLNKIVMGYYFNPQHQTIFRFDMSLNYKLPGLISKHSNGKPTLIFCNTRKSVEMTANHLLSSLQIRLTPQQKDNLTAISAQLNDAKLKQCIVHGIAFHHAGLIHDNRYVIEDSFRKGSLSVLVTTSTLAMGVNLPAHLVIVKSTKCYSDGGYKDCDEVSLFQMIGRAGRSQFDSSATALILTSMQDKQKYEQMLGCTQTIESNLHKHLTEHLNAEVALRTITDLDVAMRWLSSTFLYVRARKSPEKYKLPAGLGKEKIDKKLLEMCQIELNKLVEAGMMKMNEAIEVAPTVVGQIMAKYYVAFDTMKLFTQIAGSEILIQILAIISKCKEFSDIYIRNNDKKCLNMLNKNNHKESNRFPLAGKIKTVDMKVNCIIQAILGNLEIHDQSIICDSFKIMRNCERLANCLIEYLETRDKCYSALLNTIILAKCFRVKLWENSPYISKQLTGVGQVMSTLLMKAGKTSFKELAAANPRNLETIVGRKAPFGNTIVDEASHLPQYTMALQKQDNEARLLITLLNPSDLKDKPKLGLDSGMILLVGDSDNNILLYEKYSHSYLMDNPEVRRSISIENRNLDFVKANLISENWVGIDCCCNLDICGSVASNTNQRQRCKQTFMDIYMQHVKRTYKKKNENKTNTKENSIRAKKKENLKAPTPNTTTLDNDNSKQDVEERNSETPTDLLEKIHQENLDSTSEKNSKQTKIIVKQSMIYKPNRKEWQIMEELEKEKTAIDDEENDFSQFEKIYDKRLTQRTISKDKENKRNDLKHNENKESIDDEEEQLLLSIGKNNDSGRMNNNKETKSVNLKEAHTNKIPNDIIEIMREKYESSRKESQSHNSTCARETEETSKKTMDNPDSTLEPNKFEKGYFFVSCSKRPREHERHVSAFAEGFPQKSITWRSPLVHSPEKKFSPLHFNCANNTSESINNLGAEDTTTSISSANLSPFEASEKPCSKPLKKKPKYQFPLSDRDYAASEVNNESFSKKLDELDSICDLEEFGFTIRKKEAAKNPSKPRAAVSKYYSELLMNSQNESKSNLAKNATSSQSSEKKSTGNEQQQLSQDLFSQNGNVSNDSATKMCQDTKAFIQPAPMEHHQHTHDLSNPNDHAHTLCDALNASFVEPLPYNVSELTQRRYVNPYLDEYRPNPYFAHMCCTRNPTRYRNADPYYNPYLETVPEPAPCWDFAASRRLIPSRTYYDIPEDHCRRPIELHQPMRFMENRCCTNYFDNAQSPVLNCEKENLPPFYAEAPSCQTSRLDLSKMYAATPKSHLVHPAPAFQSHVHPSTSVQRRMLNFHSFEERLNNSLMPRSLSSFANGDQRLRQRGNEERDYVMNGFMFANNQNRTQ